eukprot:GHVR01153590.1.p1 GENE.GHVR01153590.1~~GHVR01153590.1.p1  ORF type:complete len:105 (+),score=1.29 GHVR01153590.1:221-535(+)
MINIHSVSTVDIGKLDISDEGVSMTEAKLDDIEIAANRLLGSGYGTKSNFATLRGKLQHFIQLLPPSSTILLSLITQKLNKFCSIIPSMEKRWKLLLEKPSTYF